MRLGGGGHVTHVGERRGVYKVLVEKPEEKRPLGDPGVDGKIMLRWIFRKWNLGVWTRSNCVWTGSIWLRTWTGDRHLLLR